MTLEPEWTLAWHFGDSMVNNLRSSASVNMFIFKDILGTPIFGCLEYSFLNSVFLCFKHFTILLFEELLFL